ncbi:MAG TPA: coproporphyrinogen III oxidase [Pseudomonas sp.]|nr:coproporphyrinogen III oxidase [Pseudomonas sp.]
MGAVIEWNHQLISRYGAAALAGDSYPQATQFHSAIAALDLLRALRSSRRAQRPLSLGVQLPPGGNGACDAYLQRLACEIDMLACHLGPEQRVLRLHLGGGIPDAAGLRRLMVQLQRRFNFQPDDSADRSIEIDLPRTDWATMGLLRELGFNHVSIGVPDIHPGEGGRVVDFQDPRQIRSLIEAARTLHFRSVNIDLGYGRAWQTPASFSRKLAAIIELQPSQVLVFDYAHPPRRYRSFKRIVASGFAAQADKLAMQQQAVAQLLAAGYCYIGLGQYALPDDDLAIAQETGQLHRNCQGYSRHADCDHLGFGVSASSQVGELHLQNSGDLKHYQAQLDLGQLAIARGLRCTPDEQVRRAVIERLLCDFQVNFAAIDTRFGLVFREYFATVWPQLELMAREGLILLGADRLSVLPAGRLLVGAVCKVLEHNRLAGGAPTALLALADC